MIVEPIPSKWPLPPGTLPLGLSRVQSCAYIGISGTLFDRMVEDGRMPRPKRINRRRIWDRMELDRAFRSLPDEDAELSGRPRDPVEVEAEEADWDDVQA